VELRQVRYFLAVARHGHFTRAAAELNIVQPALSQQIKRLEQELGLELFERRIGQVVLTVAGTAFLRRAERILAEVDIAQAELRDLSQTASGRVALGAIYSLGSGALDFPALLAGFSAQQPGVEVAFREAATYGLLALLRKRQLDLALIDIGLVSDSSDLEVEPLASEDYVVLVSPRHRLAERESCSLADLADEQFVRLGPGLDLPGKFIRTTEAAGFRPRFGFHTTSVPIARGLVSQGLGIHLTHPWVGEGPGPPVVTVRLDPPVLRCSVALVQPRTAYRPAAVSAFLAYAWQQLHFRGTPTQIR
jgi:DNA-binding transcriptional LysR family regulator